MQKGNFKGKFGEQTVVIRVPSSKKDDVLNFLKNFEVLDASNRPDNSVLDSYQAGYKKGFADGFSKGEEFQFVQPYALVGASEQDILLAIDLFNNRVPDSAFMVAFEHLAKLLAKASFNVSDKVVKLSALICP